MRINELLFADKSVAVSTDLSIEACVERLSSATPSMRGLSTLKAFEGQRVFGEVSPDRVRLYWVEPHVQNIFRPRFVGRFELVNGKGCLVGKIGPVVIVKAMACVVFAFVLIPSTAIALGASQGQPTTSLSIPFLTVAVMSFTGFAVVHLSQMLAWKVTRGLTDFMRTALAGSP